MTTTDTSPGSGTTITAAALAERSGASVTAPMVVDVRSAAEYESVHIRGSYHVPLATLSEHTTELAAHLERGEPVVLVCQSGARATQAQQRLAAVGLGNAQVLDGGVPAYADAGGDVVRGRQVWALERQVRLAAGSLVLAGFAAAHLVSPKARMLSLGIGAGLTFSALSNTCAMGSVLARMPWNQGTADPTPAETLAHVAQQPAR